MARGRSKKILLMSTYPPRKCGIATFTRDLIGALAGKKKTYEYGIIAMNGRSASMKKYPPEVEYVIRERNIGDYIRVARKINRDRSVVAVNIQHEFGLYGGKFLNYLSAFLETIEKPVMITLHSVVPDPPENIRSIIKYVSVKAAKLIVMAEKAVEILNKDYGVPRNKISVIPHGIHEVPYESSHNHKKRIGIGDRTVLMSFGLISGGKSYEDIIHALPGLVREYPDLMYMIIGKTHPGILRDEGEKYRERLYRLVERLHVQDHVRFVNRYLKLDDLLKYLRAADIFVSSGKGYHQVTSGTLVYAMGTGRPVVTIPFTHAREIVSRKRGILVPKGNSASYMRAIRRLLRNRKTMERMGRNSYEFTRPMLWRNVAGSYVNEIERILG